MPSSCYCLSPVVCCRRPTALLCLITLSLVVSGAAQAQTPSLRPSNAAPGAPQAALPDDDHPAPLRWDPAWPRFSLAEYIATGLGFTTGLAVAIVGPYGSHWRGGIVADESVRDALRLEDRSARWFARDLSDVLLTVMESYPFVVDALVVAGWYRRSPDVARQMALINLQTLGVTLALQSLAKLIASRERPNGRTCGTLLDENNRDCESSSRYESFFSGHTAQSFAAAGLICSHHMNLELYGGGWADVIPCAAGFSLASGVGLLRVMGDKHYLSDVMIGAAVGTLTGLGLPWLLHYRHTGAADSERDDAFSVKIVPMAAGAGLVGTF
jgi:membrane-associated phospholipid phosphatase